ncbi:dihydroxyacetone kinase, N-terminal domain [Clostridium amylolyticum]|uniref:Dihydroxyacetone kinase, N-terminal domain n=1 Tax=Clostridium amylolyticum TaxID=1121298 RepID=A0A1M6MZT1_9CLOT|nr:dihydroxyacetone kinase subunit DhaK [Clostridium amylolyticum]SHJ89015.1 dihydroxyacetone kinase, N-terminal domain [Clostridium amylolyticum]
MKSKKIINDVDNIVFDTVEGFVKAYKHKVIKLPNSNVIVRKNLEAGKVGVVIGNGSGHEPACIGFVGKNMLSANAYGGIFAAPGPDTLYDAIEAVDSGCGVCVLISNHAGDVINSKMAIDMAKDDDINCKGVILYDDIASSPKGQEEERRGTAGTLFSYKIVGAYAEEGHSLDKVVKMAEKVRDNTRTLAVATISGTSPITGYKMFEIEDDEIEIGMGVHGEAAAHTMKICTAKDIAEVMCEKLIEDKPYLEGDEITVLVNGCGQTTYMELLIFYNEVEKILNDKGIKVYKPAIGSFITTQEMGGIALAFCKLDDEMKKMWEKETDAPAFKI